MMRYPYYQRLRERLRQSRLLGDEHLPAYLRHIRKATLTLLKYWLAICLAMIGGITVSHKLAIPLVEKHFLGVRGVKLLETPGQSVEIYSGDKIPDSYNDELSFPPHQLIFERQERYYQSNHSGESSEERGGVEVPKEERKAISEVAIAFIKEWDTFSADESLNSYRRRIEPYADPSYLPSLAERADNLQAYQVGIGKLSGSRVEPDSLAEGVVVFLRYDGETAYLNTLGIVTYTGPSLAFAGERKRRSYNLVMRKTADGWKVQRCAAETMGEVG